MKIVRTLTSLFLAGALFTAAPPVLAQTTGQPGVDSDGDGIDDDIDSDPCDPRTSLKRFDPADRTWGMMLFEDNWPFNGDKDFNDAVLAYNEVLRYDSAGLFTGIQIDIRLMAVGATFTNGLAVHIPGVSVQNVEQLQLFIDGQPKAVAARPGETDLVVNLSTDLHATMGVPAGTWVNTDPGLPTTPYVDIVLIADFNPGSSVAASNAPFDIFLFNTARGTEVHLPQYRGTTSLDGTLLNTGDDGSTAQRAFVNNEGIPFALIFPEEITYPTEGTSIASLFPTIVDFGLQLPGSETFYRNPNLGHAFGNVTPGAFGAVSNPDVSCFTSDPGRCGDSTTTGHVNAPTANLCAFGTASSVSTSGGLYRWTCSGFYSTPTSCTAPDWVCQPNISASCTIANGAGSQVCNGSGTGYGACTLSSCNSGYYASGNSCLPQVCSPGAMRACTVTNGTGSETCNNLGSRWHNCTVVSCNSGYANVGGVCTQTGATDLDGDGISDSDELTLGTDAGNPDTDGDGIRDGAEVVMGTNPLVPNGRPATAGIAVTGCQHLSRNNTYYLAADIVVPPGVAQCFTTDRDVNFDCRGHSITGSDEGVAFNLSGHRYFFTMRNCDVSRFRAGVYASAHNYYLSINNSTFQHNTEYGVQTQHHNYFTTVKDSNSTFNGEDGLHLDDFAQQAMLENNVVKHNGNHGVLIREYRSWTWGWSNPTFSLVGGETFSICGNQISNNGACEYSIYSGSGPGAPTLTAGCHEPAPAESACP